MTRTPFIPFCLPFPPFLVEVHLRFGDTLFPNLSFTTMSCSCCSIAGLAGAHNGRLTTNNKNQCRLVDSRFYNTKFRRFFVLLTTDSLRRNERTSWLWQYPSVSNYQHTTEYSLDYYPLVVALFCSFKPLFRSLVVYWPRTTIYR